MSLSKNYQGLDLWKTLGEGFSDPVEGAKFPQKILRYRNQKWAEQIGLGELTDQEWLDHFSLFKPLPDSLSQPQALRYHGHQFTHYNPELGDGRGFLLAQLKDPGDGRILDLGTKGSGQTPYSRRGDGRLTLKGAVREILATTYLEYQGVNTSKTLSVIETGEELIRNDEPSPTRSAVLIRLSHSHIRFGTFQRLAYHKENEKINQLVDYVLKYYYPDTDRNDFFQAVCKQVAKTTAQWMIHGFVHGVLNTDNMNITGESFDYGPYRFLPYYDPQFTAAYFDQSSLYAYGRQAQMVFWNLERLSEALSVVFPDKSCFERGFKAFQKTFEDETLFLFCKKTGIDPIEPREKIKNLFYLTLQFLEKSKAPYEAFFNDLYCWHQDLNQPLRNLNRELYWNKEVEEIEKLLSELKRDPNAPFKTKSDLRTLLINQIEEIWKSIDQSNDWQPLYTYLNSLKVDAFSPNGRN